MHSTNRGRVLISGASIAGPALAYWLHRYGFATVIVERAPALRTGGQNIDVRGAGREVSRRMGIEDDIRAATTGEVGTRFIGPRGATIAEFPAGTTDSGGATAELEILRGDLAQLLVDRTETDTEYRYGDRITGMVQHDAGNGDPAGVTVHFEHAPDERFDLVIAADGIGSSTRRLVFGDEPEIRSLGLETTFGTIPRTDADDDWWRWYNAPGGRSITLRPDAHGTIRATMSIVTDRKRERAGSERRDLDAQRRHLHEAFADAGWEARRVLAGFDAADDLYAESIGQVRAPRWWDGRVALVGDAAYCASPVSGMGTSLSLTGAYVLAGELAAHVDHRDAFRGYERIMRPYVAQAQQLPPGTPRVANPKSRLGIAVFGAAVRIVATPLVGRLGERFSTPPADAIDLPDYAHLESQDRT
ncbi:2-polyprenyl-6-methoxyphenol hydroxylase-like FAD-dependent oxidoreductase [Curtobacterium sp. PhB130]|uniref:FAD-dependent monooxygenase n=1 Tax=Curtobacterium sp. PhB130 TaxID=2485178 RepID=UPI000F4B917F|nr:FAD-dependent monooxygenase [Curtobacterium sp. PhB130]ROS77717.1 2-polyprenyl-6-methoxyphenol hydroxylase-like FAD-dependent oxidoreductase [Curtobacterium sp. PhB130]